jgi:CrcB protein
MFRRLDVMLAVLLGGFAGGAARYGTVRAWPTGSSGFPWSTLAVNLSGAALLGALVVLSGTVWRSRYSRPLLGTGLCGALTTFSAVVVDVDRLFARGEPGIAVGYLSASFVGGLAAAFVGIVVARALVQSRPSSAAG